MTNNYNEDDKNYIFTYNLVHDRSIMDTIILCWWMIFPCFLIYDLSKYILAGDANIFVFLGLIFSIFCVYMLIKVYILDVKYKKVVFDCNEKQIYIVPVNGVTKSIDFNDVKCIKVNAPLGFLPLGGQGWSSKSSVDIKIILKNNNFYNMGILLCSNRISDIEPYFNVEKPFWFNN